MNYSNFRYRPVVGLSGCGKSEFLDKRRAIGNQVVSVEALAGVTGVCLAPAFDTPLISQSEFDERLLVTFETFDFEQEVWVEWKGTRVTGLALPPAPCNTVRRGRALFIDAELEERVERLVTCYSEWAEHLDSAATKLASIPEMNQDVANKLRQLAEERDVHAFVRTMLTRHFDPLYEREFAHFKMSTREAEKYSANAVSPSGALSVG